MRLFEYRWVVFVRRHASLIAFVSGFAFDALTLTRIDELYGQAVFLCYLFVAAGTVVLIQAVEADRRVPRVVRTYRAWLPALVQFPMGGLLSGFVLFYSKSASLLTSWPFLVILIAVFIGNEFFKRRYELLVFQIGMLTFALLSYSALTIPILYGDVGTIPFLLSGLSALFVLALVFQGIMRVAPSAYHTHFRYLVGTVGAVTIIWNIAYFTNLIPPVPLALKDIGIFHSLTKAPSDGYLYRVTYEAAPWYLPWRTIDTTFRVAGGDGAYCYSAVFAPTSISTRLFHRWEYYSSAGWVTRSRIPWSVQGGRDGGYRWYSVKGTLEEGRWRCVVETEWGAVLGVDEFTVLRAESTPLLVETRK